MKDKIKNYFIENLNLVLNRSFIIDLFAETEYLEFDLKSDNDNKLIIDFSNISNEKKLSYIYNKNYFFKKRLLVSNKKLYYIDDINYDNFTISVKLLIDKLLKQPILNIYDKITITKDQLPIKLESDNILTTYGLLILNQALFILPFSKYLNYFTYKNDSLWNFEDIKNKIRDLYIEKKIDTESVFTFWKNVEYLAVYCDLFVPSITEQLLTPNDQVEQLKNQLIEKYKDKLDNNTLIKIEDQLIALDKKLALKDQQNKIITSDKTFSNHRKQMFINIGSVERLGSDKKEINFINDNLDKGLTPKSLPVLFNNVRNGIAGRAMDTANSGAMTKEIARFLADVSIIEEDCKTKRYITFKVTKNNKNNILYRHLIEDDKLILLTNNNINKYIGKTIKLRSPQTCETKGGYCYKCGSYIWELKKLDVLNVVPISISSTLMMIDMKKMHTLKVNTYQIDNLNDFII